MDLVLGQDLVDEVSARYDAFSIFKLGKKCIATFSTWDLYLTLKINFENCSLGTKFYLLSGGYLLGKFQVGWKSHYRDSTTIGRERYLS